MDKTLQSLHIFNFIDGLIKKLIDSLVEVNDQIDGNSMLYVSVKNDVLIHTKSFLDEWNKGLIKLTEDKDKEILIARRKKAKPAIDRLKKWEDLNTYRNSVLAHGFRKGKADNYEIVFLGDFLPNYNVPDHISEIVLISEVIRIATTIISEPFEEQLRATSEKLYRPREPRKPVVVDVEKEVNEIIKEIEAIKT